MKLLKKILIGLVVLILAVVVVSQFLPSTYHAERSVTIAAKPPAIHPWINDLKKWPEWSPWTAAKDPTLVYAYEGSEQGVGAVSKWDSKKFGDGMMKIVESDPAKGVKFDLSFNKGKYLSVGKIAFEPAGESTKVTWSMDGTVGRNPLDRIFSVMMEKMIGPDFDEGLGKLKAKAEAKP
jgi:hypothetical protein